MYYTTINNLQKKGFEVNKKIRKIRYERRELEVCRRIRFQQKLPFSLRFRTAQLCR